MANRSQAHGLTRDARNKIDAKYSPDNEKESMQWIEQVIGKTFYTESGQSAVHGYLKDGKLLCELINAISPGSVKNINTSKLAFKEMENINHFLEGCRKYGLTGTDLFQTVDLYEMQNMHQVILTLYALGRKSQVKGFTGPTLGPKESEKNERQFSEEQLKAGQGVIGLQMGSNKGASQAGQNFGKPRSIMD